MTGSTTTLAQLGIPDPLTPAKLRVKSRMFLAEKEGEWEPYKVKPKNKQLALTNGTENKPEDQMMGGTDDKDKLEAETEYEEDRITDEGAVWPIVGGKIVNWSCFYALLIHVYQTSSPTLKSPIVLVTQPQWTHSDIERVAQFIFEKFKPPAVMLIDSATATLHAHRISSNTGTVVDIGYETCDITAVVDGTPDSQSRLTSVPDYGGRGMTLNLLRMLESEGFNEDMCEQLKRSNICEILPLDAPLPTEIMSTNSANPVAVTLTGLATSTTNQTTLIGLPRGRGLGTEIGEEALEDDGVLDVVTLVASGKTSEYLAKKEKEKAERAVARKNAKGNAAAGAKPMRLPNAQRVRATFQYESQATNSEPNGLSEPGTTAVETEGDSNEAVSANTEKTSLNTRKEIEVGTERFQADGQDHEMLSIIADSISRCIKNTRTDARSDLWNNIMVVGNGAKVKGKLWIIWLRSQLIFVLGFREALLAILQTKYVVSPTNTTMFTSELPSSFSTPAATGANTPLPGAVPSGLPLHAGVNPLLVAATTASNPNLAPPGLQQHQQFRLHAIDQATHTRHSQGPTSVQISKMPEYFSEWKDHGWDEAAFLGAQILSHVGIVQEFQGVEGEQFFMKRVDYNKQGPKGIHRFCF